MGLKFGFRKLWILMELFSTLMGSELQILVWLGKGKG